MAEATRHARYVGLNVARISGIETMSANTEIDRPNTEPWRRPNGQFGVGNPGKPRGARHRASKAEIERLRSRSERMWALVDQKLEEGCTKTLLFLLARLLPDSRTVDLDTSDPSAMADAVVDGSLSPVEANRISQSLKHLKEIQQVDAIAERLSEIERLLAVQGRG